MKKSNEKDTSAESLLKFSQSAPERQPYEFDTIGEHVGNEIEVCYSLSLSLSFSLLPLHHGT